MALLVEKYGGTSVKDSHRLRIIAENTRKKIDEGHQVVMVVSAPGGMTDELVARAQSVTSNPSGRELDVLLSTGEQISIALMAMALESLGVRAISYTASQLGILTEGDHNNARIARIDTGKIEEKLSQGYVVIIAGFQGISERGCITTLGRGGSDTSAVAIGAALGACEVDIYTDVDGIYSGDPRIIESPLRHTEISFDEMIEMAGSGAKVLHSRSVELAAKYDIGIHLRSSFEWTEGTRVKGEVQVEKSIIRGISATDNLTKISVEGRGVRLAETIGNISKSGANIDVITHNCNSGRNEISCIIKDEYLERALSSIGEGTISYKKDLSKVSVIGLGVKSKGIAATVFDILSEEGIEIEAVSCSEINISCIIPGKHSVKVQQILHRELIEPQHTSL